MTLDSRPGGRPRRETPYSVRGVSMDARSAVSLAAKKAGQAPGEWLTRVILDAASAELKNPAKPVGPTLETMVSQIHQSLQEQAERLASIENAQKAAGAKRGFLGRLGPKPR